MDKQLIDAIIGSLQEEPLDETSRMALYDVLLDEGGITNYAVNWFPKWLRLYWLRSYRQKKLTRYKAGNTDRMVWGEMNSLIYTWICTRMLNRDQQWPLGVNYWKTTVGSYDCLLFWPADEKMLLFLSIVLPGAAFAVVPVAGLPDASMLIRPKKEIPSKQLQRVNWRWSRYSPKMQELLCVPKGEPFWVTQKSTHEMAQSALLTAACVVCRGVYV